MKKKDTPNQAEDHTQTAASAKDSDTRSAAKPALSEKQRRELWLYIAVSIATVELLIATGAILYGFIVPGSGNAKSFAFPWLSWGAVAVIVPTLILLLVHFADVGLFRPPGRDSDSEWQEHLPERMQRIYSIIRGAPVIVILLAIILLGFALMTLDGALSALVSLGSVLVPYIPHIVGAVVLLAAIFTGASAWLSYRTRKLMAEYEFRRQVLEQTGIIIVDKHSHALPPGAVGDAPLAITAGEEGKLASMRALPGEEDMVITAEAREVAQDATDNAENRQDETQNGAGSAKNEK